MALMAIRGPVVAVLCAWAAIVAPEASQADDASRISFLESEIQRLRSQLGDQDRRIQRLEAELERLGVTGMAGRSVERRASPATSGGATTSGPQPWHASEAWDRVAKGMTQQEVIKVLGQPTAIQSVDNYKTLFYKGLAAGGRTVDGLVNLRDERVIAVKKPD
jgi:hypothetical protein